MKLALFTSFFAPAFLGGGPIRTLTAMLDEAPPSFDVSVVTGNTDLGSRDPLKVPSDVWVRHKRSRVFYCNTKSAASLFRGMSAVKQWAPDAIYVNSFFDYKFSVLPQLLFFVKLFQAHTLAIAPRGEFNEGALNIKSSKKRTYIWLYRRLQLAKKVIWHASTVEEAVEIMGLFGDDVRIVIREDDTNLPSAAVSPDTPADSGSLRAVSLSRLSPKKGIDTLLHGLQGVTEKIVLDVIGPAEDSEYSQRCRLLASSLPPNIIVNFLGAIPHSKIGETLARYDVMFCPTKGENFGHVIAEALSVSCPVLCADVTPWTSRLLAGGGVVVDENSAQRWGHAASAYARLSAQERYARRLSAGRTYDRWKSGSTETHFFSLLQKAALL